MAVPPGTKSWYGTVLGLLLLFSPRELAGLRYDVPGTVEFSSLNLTYMVLSDVALARWFWLFAFCGCVFEPLYYAGCNWNGAECGDGVVPRIWRLYSSWDPLFLDMTAPSLLWLRVMCTLECVVFGPCYAAVAVGLQPFRPEGLHTPWLQPLALLFSGALVYSTVVYFAMEVVLANSSGADMTMVFLINGPWTVIPCILAYKTATVTPPPPLGYPRTHPD